AEEGAQTQYIWSHRWNMANYKRTYDKTLIDNYAINPETRGGSAMRMVGIGVFCHEFGHLLGLPDLYDVSKKSEGIGNWSVMAGGNWLNNENTPANFCAFTRTYMKWIKPVVLEEEGYYTLRPSSKDSLVYRINTPVKHEYFLLENRQLTGFDAKLNGKGMAIWHINDSVINRTMGGNNVNANFSKKGVDLEEADGKDDLDKSRNRGDGGDLFPGTSKRYSFSDATTPSAQNFNGNNTGVNIFNITNLPDSGVRFGYSAPPKVAFSAPLVVCQNTLVSFQNNSKFASKFTWNFNNENTDTLVNTTYTFTTPGEQFVKLKGTSLVGIDAYDSFKINVLPAAEANFTVHPEGYTAHITNNSANAVRTMIFWGDGTKSENERNLSHTYSDTGLFKVVMVCYSNEGCSDTTRALLRLPASQADVFPNPFRDKLELNFEIAEAGPVNITLYNILGQQVLHVPNSNYNAGRHHIKLDLNNRLLPAGAYTLKLQVNDKPEQIKLIKW
ncbi:MAG: M6 family metalloprotease domain-containing protein, partial [Bacteroidia bacterium]